MAITLKCPDCGHTEQAETDAPQTCPQCEGTMKKAAYKAKAAPTSSDKAKPKPAAEPLPLDDDEDAPRSKPRAKPKAAAQPMSLDDEGGEGGRNGEAAESLGLEPGFSNRALMKQVEEELARGEVLHWVSRPSMKLAQKEGKKLTLIGFVIAGVGALFSAIFFAVAPWFFGLFPLIFIAAGVAVAILGPKATLKQAQHGWYAVTDRRAIIYRASTFGTGGEATSYEPDELKRMRVKKSSSLSGAGDLIFKTETRRSTHTSRVGGRTRVEEQTHTIDYGFLGIENVREVETLIHNVLLGDDV